jgi:hypothetical protein
MNPLADLAHGLRSRPGAGSRRDCHSRALVLVSAPAGLIGLSLLASACGGSTASHVARLGSTTDGTPTAPTTRPSSAPTSSTGSAHLSAALAFARCMRSHGVPNFPDPDPQGDFPPFHTGVSKQISAAADDACEHLLSSGGTATPGQRQQKLAFGIKVAECLRAHGYPDFPDPTGLGSQSLPPAIDPNSPQFQTTENNCEKQVRKVLGLP